MVRRHFLPRQVHKDRLHPVQVVPLNPERLLRGLLEDAAVGEGHREGESFREFHRRQEEEGLRIDFGEDPEVAVVRNADFPAGGRGHVHERLPVPVEAHDGGAGKRFIPVAPEGHGTDFQPVAMKTDLQETADAPEEQVVVRPGGNHGNLPRHGDTPE